MSTGMKALAVVVGNHMTKRYEDVAKTAADRDYWKGLYFAQEFSYIETRLELCPQYGGDDCATAQEIGDFFTQEKYEISFAFKE